MKKVIKKEKTLKNNSKPENVSKCFLCNKQSTKMYNGQPVCVNHLASLRVMFP